MQLSTSETSETSNATTQDFLHCVACAEEAAGSSARPGARPRVIEQCGQCSSPPLDEIELEHYWVLGGSD